MNPDAQSIARFGFKLDCIGIETHAYACRSLMVWKIHSSSDSGTASRLHTLANHLADELTVNFVVFKHQHYVRLLKYQWSTRETSQAIITFFCHFFWNSNQILSQTLHQTRFLYRDNVSIFLGEKKKTIASVIAHFRMMTAHFMRFRQWRTKCTKSRIRMETERALTIWAKCECNAMVQRNWNLNQWNQYLSGARTPFLSRCIRTSCSKYIERCMAFRNMRIKQHFDCAQQKYTFHTILLCFVHITVLTASTISNDDWWEKNALNVVEVRKDHKIWSFMLQIHQHLEIFSFWWTRTKTESHKY